MAFYCEKDGVVKKIHRDNRHNPMLNPHKAHIKHLLLKTINMNNSIKQVLAEEQIKLQDICETINACKISKERRLPNLFPPDAHWDEQEEINKVGEALNLIENGNKILHNLVATQNIKNL